MLATIPTTFSEIVSTSPRALGRLEVASRNGHPDELEGSEDRVSATVARKRLLEALAELPPGDRDVVVLVAWEDLTYEEVAAVLDIPLGTVRSRLNRARRMLRERLEDFGNEPVRVNSKPLLATAIRTRLPAWPFHLQSESNSGPWADAGTLGAG